VAAGGYLAHEADQESVYIFEAATGRLVKRLGGVGEVIYHLAFSPDGSRLVATADGGEGIRLWETGSWQLLAEDKDYGDEASYGAAFDSGNRLFTVADDGQIRRYGADGHLEAKGATQGGKEPFSIAVHPKQAKLAVGFSDSTAVEVHDALTLKLLYAANTSGISKGSSNGVAWSADGARLYAGKATEDPFELFIWAKEGRGKRSETPLSQDSIVQLLPCAASPLWERYRSRSGRSRFRPDCAEWRKAAVAGRRHRRHAG
jgi:WD40 repeat protein